MHVDAVLSLSHFCRCFVSTDNSFAVIAADYFDAFLKFSEIPSASFWIEKQEREREWEKEEKKNHKRQRRDENEPGKRRAYVFAGCVQASERLRVYLMPRTIVSMCHSHRRRLHSRSRPRDFTSIRTHSFSAKQDDFSVDK